MPIGPQDSSRTPRFAGIATFALLPRVDQVPHADVKVVGVPFDSGVSYRPGARFGPAHVRESSRLLRPYNPVQDVSPFEAQQVADAGDIAVNPFDIGEAVRDIETAARELAADGARLLAIGGDHTIALPLLRVTAERHGPVAVVHFDAHLDGTRGPLYGREDLRDDARLGFAVIASHEVEREGLAAAIDRMHARLGDRPVYVSVDIDVLDPAHAPGTGTPEAGGLTSRELLEFLRALRQHRLVGADVVEVAPAYDHAQITGIAAAHVAYEIISSL
jgi:agmatinase